MAVNWQANYHPKQPLEVQKSEENTDDTKQIWSDIKG